MASLDEGGFEFNAGIVKLSGKLKEIDRQCAWELYAEIATRVAVSGKRNDPGCKNFDGELLVESLNSLYAFFKECRNIMRTFPVGRIKNPNQQHLGCVIHKHLADVLRPFLEKWHVKFRDWWESNEEKDLPPFERQKKFPEYDQFVEEWAAVRRSMRALEQVLVSEYNLTNLEETEIPKLPVI